MKLNAFHHDGRKQHKHIYFSFLKHFREVTLILIGVVAFAFTLVWDNLCRNSCTLYQSKGLLLYNYYDKRIAEEVEM